MPNPVAIPAVKKGLAVAGALGTYAFGSAASLIYEARKKIRKDEMQQPRSAATSEEKPK